MNVQDFEEIGLTKSEAQVYLALVHRNNANARLIIEDTSMHKKIVYDNLDRLISKGLVSVLIINKKKQFQTEPPNALQELMHKKVNEAKKYEEKATRIIEELTRIQPKPPSIQTTTMFIGTQGVKQVLINLISLDKEYIAIGAPKESVDILGETFWRNLHAKQNERKVKGRLLFNHSLRSWAKTMPKKRNVIKFLEAPLEPLTETIVAADRTAIIVWTTKPVVTVIIDNLVADSYRAFFDILWKQAEK